MVQENVQEEVGVKILLVGDSGVGKTSLINSLVSHEFNADLPARLIGVTIAAEINPERIPLHVEDYSDREQNQNELELAVQDASAVCVIFAANQNGSFERVFSYWLPTIRKCLPLNAAPKPIILANNKIDLKSLVSDSKIAAKIRDNVDGFIQVSALTQENVVELFYFAQKSVIFPKAPLFDSQSHVITKKCRSALIEIFKLCDLDRDGLLSDHEMNLFQENCFGTPLERDNLDDIKSIIKQSTNDGIKNNGITLSGFLFLHTLLIDRGQPNFTWRVLRNFNYDDNIDIKDDNNSKTVNGLVNDFSRKISLSDQSDSVGAENLRQVSDQIEESDDEESDEDDDYKYKYDNLRGSQVDLTWIKQNSKVIKAGFGFTLVTMVSVLALKYLARGP